MTVSFRSRSQLSVLAVLAAIASIAVLLAPPANAATNLLLQPGNFKYYYHADRVQNSARGTIIRIRPTTEGRMSMVGVKARTATRTTHKLDRWVRANHGRKARMCAMMRGGVHSVNAYLDVNGLHRGTQKTFSGSKHRLVYVRTAWRKHCMNFTVIGRPYYKGDATITITNSDLEGGSNLFVDWVSVKLL